MKNIKIAPSVMCADQLRLGEELAALYEAGADMFHIDVMDGEFVPNIQLGCALMQAIKKQVLLPLDVHLMIRSPDMKLSYFPFGDGDTVSVHYGSLPHPGRALSGIKARGARALLALDPSVPVCVCEDIVSLLDGILIMTVEPGYAGQKLIPGTLDKIKAARKLLDGAGKHGAPVEVDGNVSFENAVIMKEYGADILVCGSSSLFNGEYSYKEAIEKLKEAR